MTHDQFRFLRIVVKPECKREHKAVIAPIQLDLAPSDRANAVANIRELLEVGRRRIYPAGSLRKSLVH